MSQFSFIYPGGRIRQINLVDKAGNTAQSQGPAAGFRWIFLYGRLTFTADANAGNRYVDFSVYDGTNKFWIAPREPAMTANNTYNISYANITEQIGGEAAEEAHIGVGFLMVDNPSSFRVSIGNGLAGDLYTWRLSVLEVEV